MSHKKASGAKTPAIKIPSSCGRRKKRLS